jgi:glutamate synthase (NADPH/NADH) small chain
MGIVGAYLETDRHEHGVRPGRESVRDYREFVVPLSLDEQERQASRCMNCGVAFCQSGFVFPGAKRVSGCPLHNLIPETNDLLCRGRMADAAARLALTNPFPEFTSRVCPAPCEQACNLGLHEEAVTIHDDERAISDWAWENSGAGTLAFAPAAPGAPLVSVIGSGPAGLACAWELGRSGVRVRLYERDDRAGGLLMYGIPSMKLPKDVVERRVELMRSSGIDVHLGVDAADPETAASILAESDAVVLATGARLARIPDLPGIDLAGVSLALEYLTISTRHVLDGDPLPAELDAQGKDVVVIGGGDTGVDCVATALRQGARSVRQIIRAACPDPAHAAAWPCPRDEGKTGYGQREAEEVLGADPRMYSTDTLAFKAASPEIPAVSSVCVQDFATDGRTHVEGTERELPAQLVVIAKGFVGPERPALEAFGVSVATQGKPLPIVRGTQGTHRASGLAAGEEAEGAAREAAEAGKAGKADRAGNADAGEGACATPVYVAGDVRTGSSLVVSAIADGLDCAREVLQELASATR